MISPTGKGIRVDSEGDGNYGTSRGDRVHNGIDYESNMGQEVVAPFDMRITRVSYPNRDLNMSGVAWEKGKSEGRMFYLDPILMKIGADVKQGEVIGYAQDVSSYYGLPNMKNHIHFQVNK